MNNCNIKSTLFKNLNIQTELYKIYLSEVWKDLLNKINTVLNTFRVWCLFCSENDILVINNVNWDDRSKTNSILRFCVEFNDISLATVRKSIIRGFEPFSKDCIFDDVQLLHIFVQHSRINSSYLQLRGTEFELKYVYSSWSLFQYYLVFISSYILTLKHWNVMIWLSIYRSVAIYM